MRTRASWLCSILIAGALTLPFGGCVTARLPRFGEPPSDFLHPRIGVDIDCEHPDSEADQITCSAFVKMDVGDLDDGCHVKHCAGEGFE